MFLTYEQIESARTDAGGYTKAQMIVVGYLLNTKITPKNIYPNNWKERLTMIEVSELWFSKFKEARLYNSKDLNKLGYPLCTGLSTENAKSIYKTDKRSSIARARRMKRRHQKRLANLA